MSINFLIVESPWSKRSSVLDFGFGQVVASTHISEHFLTDWDRSLDGSVDDLLLRVEGQVHHVEVVSSVDWAHVWDAFAKMMGYNVSVALQYSVDSTVG